MTDYSLVKLRLPERTIGDSQTGRFGTDEVEYGYLTLETDAGRWGYGFDLVNLRAPGTLTEDVLRSQLEDLAAGVGGRSPFALWDLAAKREGLQLYELLGGEDPRVPVYASGLSFPNDEAATRRVYEEFADIGTFHAAKVKVGFPTVAPDQPGHGVELDDDVVEEYRVSG